MCKFESSQKYESRAQSADFSKAYRNTRAFKALQGEVRSFPQFSPGTASQRLQAHKENALTERAR